MTDPFVENTWAALRMIREALEEFVPIPSAESVLRLHGLMPTDEAGVLVEAILAFRKRMEEGE